MRQISVKFTGGAVYGFTSSYQLTNDPYLYLFKKKDSHLPIHTHFLVLHFLNYILCFPIPFNKHDGFFYNQPFNPIDFPPMLPEHMLSPNLNFQRFFEDMANEEKIYNQKDELNITIDPIQPGVSAAYDLNSGKMEERPYDPSSFMQILITRSSNSQNLDELSQLIKKTSKKNDDKE